MKKKELEWLFVLPIFLLAFNFIYFVHQNFVHTNQEVQKDWQYGYKEAVEYINQNENKNKKAIFAKDFEQPYVFYLFYTNYDPAKYIASGGSSRTSQKCYAIDTAYFGDCGDKLTQGDIFVALGSNGSEKGKVLKEIKYSTQEPAVTIYQHL